MRCFRSRFAFFLACLLCAIATSAQNPLAPVEELYRSLDRSELCTNLPAICADADVYANALREGRGDTGTESADDIVFRYLQAHKGLLTLGELGGEESYRRYKKGYLFFNPPKGDLFTQGHLFVFLSSPQTGLTGMVKQVSIPVERSTQGYRIVLSSVMVNGVYLDSIDDFQGERDFISLLGGSRKKISSAAEQRQGHRTPQDPRGQSD